MGILAGAIIVCCKRDISSIWNLLLHSQIDKYSS